MNKKVIIITAGRVSQMLIMFFTYRVLSTVLSVQDMGNYYFLLSISAAFGLIYANPLVMYATRMLHSWKQHNVMVKNLNAILVILLVGSLLTAPLLFIFKDKFILGQMSWSIILSVLVLYSFSTMFNSSLLSNLNILGFSNHFVVWTLFTNTVGLILSYVFVKFVHSDPLFWLLGQGLSFLFFGAVAYFVIKKNSVEIKRDNPVAIMSRVKRVIQFTLPIMVTNVAVWILVQSFRFFYKENVDLTLLGELAFGLGLATALCVAIEYLFHQLYLPNFYKQINNDSFDKGDVWNNLIDKILPFYILFTFYIIGLAPFIMRILADSKFKNSGYFLALGAGVEFLRMLGNLFAMATQSEMKTHKAVGPYLTGALVALSGIIYISYHPALVGFTPFVLMIGHLVACSLLIRNVKSMIEIRIFKKSLFKFVGIGVFFLLPIFLHHYSKSLVFSILINAVFGCVLFLYLYKLFLERGEE